MWIDLIRPAGRLAGVLGIVPLLLFESAAAQTTANSPARMEAFSKLPDWSGL